MTRREFNERFAATPDNWFEPATLDRLNDLAYASLTDIDISATDDYLLDQFVKSAFDDANNAL